MPRFAPDLRRWIRHFRDLSGYNRLWALGSADPSSPRLISPWISDTVQLVTQVSPNLLTQGIPAPGAGAEWSVVVPNDVNWKLVSVVMLLTADANVANRLVSLELRAATALVWRFLAEASQPASTAVTYVAAALGVQSPATLATFNSLLIPPNVWLPRNFIFQTVTENIQVGDAFSSIALMVEEHPG